MVIGVLTFLETQGGTLGHETCIPLVCVDAELTYVEILVAPDAAQRRSTEGEISALYK